MLSIAEVMREGYKQMQPRFAGAEKNTITRSAAKIVRLQLANDFTRGLHRLAFGFLADSVTCGTGYGELYAMKLGETQLGN